MQANAQLSGTYSICTSSCNYSSFSAAVSDLNSKGISGAVTFNVSSGTYVDYISITTVTGASSVNTITFKGAGRTKTILKGSSGSNIVLVNGISYVIFDGMTIQNTSGSGSAVYFNNTGYCSLLNSNITGVAGTGSQVVYAYNTNYLTVNNCYLSGGNNTFYFTGSGSSTPIGNLVLSNNRITKFSNAGVFVNNSNGYPAANNLYENNVLDSSASSSGYGFYSQYESGPIFRNNKIFASTAYGMLLYYPDFYNTSAAYQVINNWITSYSFDGLYMYLITSGGNVIIAHNTIYSDSTSTVSGALYINNSLTNKSVTIENNILEMLKGSFAALSITGNASGYNMIDGNDIVAPGQTFASLFSGYISDFNTYKTSMAAYGWEKNATNIKPVYIAASSNLHLNQGKLAPSGIYAGIDTDIDGDKRCKLFPTAGADESNYGKGAPTVKFYLPAVTYPNSPTTVFQNGKAGEPKMYQWFLNGTKVSDSLVLVSSAFKVGVNTLKLVTTTCGGKDSFQINDTVKAPTKVPSVDFISSFNKIKTGDVVTLMDASTNGPTTWQWQITPEFNYLSGTKTPNYSYIYGSTSTPDNQVQFTTAGKYKVCLTASNSVGSGTALCKTDYITVYPSYNLGSVNVIKDTIGYLFDNGGPNGNYKAGSVSNGYIQSVLIDPCADSVFLTFNTFDTYCGYDYVRLYSGRDNKGTPLWSGKCTGTGPMSLGPGYVGGKAYSCTYACMPNVVKPDTFKAKQAMYIEMVCFVASNSTGFSAYWWSKPKKGTKATAAFTTSGSGDSVCVDHSLTFTNTSKTDPNDPPAYLWDLDGDMTTFECVGACKTAVQTYYLKGPVKITLIATSCGGTDTVSKTITVYYPAAPATDFTVDNQGPTTSETAFFNASIAACVDDYKWTITKSSGSGTGTATYINGTSNASASPQVMFSDTGYYDVQLYADNFSGNKTVTKTKYIHVRQAYCVPGVANLLSDLGIRKVLFNTINNSTTPAATEYSNFVNTPSLSTTVELGISYNLSVSRDTPVYNTMIRTVYIDWNENGIFESGEKVAVDSNSTSKTWTTKIKVPKTAKTGSTVMRIAVNNSSYTNYPCGQNQMGEYQDYRLYVTPYHTKPVISLKGKNGLSDTIYLENGNTYVEDGYSAYSLMYGDVTSMVVVSKKSIPGIPYPGAILYSYNVQDSAGLFANTQYRVVLFTKDTTPPTLLISSPDTTKTEVFYPVHLPTVSFVYDLVTKNLTVKTDSSQLDINNVGIYTIIYTVTDSAGNTTTVKRYIKVIDTIAPVLVLNGNNSDTIKVFTSYNDPGVKTSDNYYKSSILDTLVKITTNLDTSAYGTYIITYNLTDPSGNKAKPVTRIVVVKDMIPPTVTLKGGATDSVEVNNNYVDPGTTIIDNRDKISQMTITKTGTFYTAFPSGFANKTGNNYTITYTAVDRAGNKGSATRIVKVQDRTAPVITLIGNQLISVCRWFKYKDAGYSLSDNYDSIYQITVDSTGTYYTAGGTTLQGIYTIVYIATDRAGNKSKSDSRAVQVIAASDAPCKNGIEQELNGDQYITIFPNPNTGIFTIHADFPGSNPGLKITVTNILGMQIEEINNGILVDGSYKADMSAQPAGIYFLNIDTGNAHFSRKIEIVK
jgi:PKD repeat protein